jgi:hypothetical protein
MRSKWSSIRQSLIPRQDRRQKPNAQPKPELKGNVRWMVGDRPATQEEIDAIRFHFTQIQFEALPQEIQLGLKVLYDHGKGELAEEWFSHIWTGIPGEINGGGRSRIETNRAKGIRRWVNDLD